MTLATSPAHLVELIVSAYNAGDAEQVERLFEADAALVVRPGEQSTGAARSQALREFMALGLDFSVTLRHAYQVGDLALLICDHVAEGTGPDGSPLRLTGTATDVARRGPDGFWRYVIDNPAGTDRA